MITTSWRTILAWRRCTVLSRRRCTILAGRRSAILAGWRTVTCSRRRAVLTGRRSVLTLWRAVWARRWLPVPLLLTIAWLLAIGLMRRWIA
jgi:hypothetical protein